MSGNNVGEEAGFLLRWWQEILSGTVMILTGWLLKSKGATAAIMPMSEEEIEHRMLICKQAIILSMKDVIESHDDKLTAILDRRDERLIERINQTVQACQYKNKQ